MFSCEHPIFYIHIGSDNCSKKTTFKFVCMVYQIETPLPELETYITRT